MNIGDVMIADVTSCSKEESLHTAAMRMRSRGCGALPVVDSHARVVGMLTDRDVCLAACAHDLHLSELRVASAMSASPRTCRAEDDLASAGRMMREHRIRRLPVVDGAGKLVGIISVGDLASEALRAGSALEQRAVLETVCGTSHFHEAPSSRV